MSSLTLEIKTLLTTVSNLYIGSLPVTPDNVVGLYNSGGYPRGLTESQLEEPTFQVRVRNTSYATGEALCSTISDLLHGKSTNKALAIYQQGGALDIGRDTSNRQEWTINFRAYYKK